MRLQPDQIQTQAVTGYGLGWIALNGDKFTHSLIISSAGLRQKWPFSDPNSLGEMAFSGLQELDIELLIYGSGDSIVFAPAEWLRELTRRGIGVETMDTKAACRTYNILAGEGRKVAAALLIQGGTKENQLEL